MTRRGQKKHLKRLPAPKHWPIKRKAGKFTITPTPGPHQKEYSLPLGIILREALGYAENMREVKVILSNGDIRVDGRTRKDPGYTVGVMDVIEILSEGVIYRLLPKKRGGLRFVPITENESKFKLCRVENKRMIPGGKLELTLHDGRNIIIDENFSEYSTLDTLKIAIPDQKILDKISLHEGAIAIVTRGRNIGIQGKIIQIERRYGTHASTVTVEDPTGERFQTALDYVFVLGEKKSEVNLDEGGSSE